jgi:ABC-type transport system involved in multi-copper enzyme maturation permease subunit
LLILGSFIGEINNETYEIDFLLAKRITKKQLLISKILTTSIMSITVAIIALLCVIPIIIYFTVTYSSIIILDNNITSFIGLIISVLVICFSSGAVASSFGY